MGTRKKGSRKSAQSKSEHALLAFHPKLESLASELYDYVCRGAQDLVQRPPQQTGSLEDDDFRRSVYIATHHGFKAGQELAIERLSQPSELLPGEEMLVRQAMDTVAWQMIGTQLYVARRMYRGHKPPSIVDPGFNATRAAAAELTSDDLHCFALISDLTSFIQIGDLLVYHPGKGHKVVEVKSGKKNLSVAKFATDFARSGDKRSLQLFRQREGEKTFQQLGRILRQGARMEHLTESWSSGDSFDPDTGERVVVSDEPIEMELWEPELAHVLEASREPGWAIAHVDDALFIGAYRDPCRQAGKHVFRTWFEQCGGKPDYPLVSLMSEALHPLALPVFLRGVSKEDKLDLLFGRVVVYLALNVDELIAVCTRAGLKARWSTRKEASHYGQKQAWKSNGRAVLINAHDMWTPLADGMLFRILFHGMKPSVVPRMIERLCRTAADAT